MVFEPRDGFYSWGSLTKTKKTQYRHSRTHTQARLGTSHRCLEVEESSLLWPHHHCRWLNTVGHWWPHHHWRWLNTVGHWSSSALTRRPVKFILYFTPPLTSLMLRKYARSNTQRVYQAFAHIWVSLLMRILSPHGVISNSDLEHRRRYSESLICLR